MRKLLIIAALMLGSCTSQTPEQEQQKFEHFAKYTLKQSSVVCADGNQIRFAIYATAGTGTSFTAWTILNPDGTPKRCVRREKPSTPQYEEVPQ